jgi:hypothetical protein
VTTPDKSTLKTTLAPLGRAEPMMEDARILVGRHAPTRKAGQEGGVQGTAPNPEGPLGPSTGHYCCILVKGSGGTITVSCKCFALDFSLLSSSLHLCLASLSSFSYPPQPLVTTRLLYPSMSPAFCDSTRPSGISLSVSGSPHLT